jgi:two-component system, OmpR family, response regulator
MKVLLIDDEDDIRRIARLSLARIGGMDVVDVSSGALGVETAARERPDAILLDVMMPSMDGPTTLGALRGDPLTAEIPVIFLTAKAMPTEVDRLKGLGALGVVVKPFDPMLLAQQVRALVEN